MRLLISADDLNAFPALKEKFNLNDNLLQIGQPFHSEAFPPFTADLQSHGKTGFEAALHLSGQLIKESYHLVLLLGTCIAGANESQWLNVIRSIPLCKTQNLTSVYDAGLMDQSLPPHQRGGLINLTNAYFNVFLPIPKVLGYSFPEPESIGEQLAGNMVAGISISGLQYAALHHKANFYQLRWPGEINREAESSLIRILESIQ